MAVVALSVLATGIFVLAWAFVSMLTVAGARHRTRRQSRRLAQLPDLYSMTEVADIDEALERILAEEHGALPGRLPS
jgi:hypothetical protein